MRLRDFFENRPRQEEALEVAAAEQEATREALVATEMRLLAMEEILERRESELEESAEAMETMQVGVEFRHTIHSPTNCFEPGAKIPVSSELSSAR